MSARDQLDRIRSRLRVDKTEQRRTVAAMGTAFALGAMEKAGTLSNVPVIGDLPKTVTVAMLAKVGASFVSGDMSDYLNGAGDAAASIALYQFAKGETVAGVDDDYVSGERLSAMEQRLKAKLGAGGSDREELIDQLRERLSRAA